MLTELGGSQVEVQRCSLSSDGPRLRSSCAHCGSGCKGGGGEAGGEGGGGEGGGG